MEKGEAHPIRKRRAIERGRRISNLSISFILSWVVTAAAQTERTAVTDQTKERNAIVTATPTSGVGYKPPERSVKTTLTISNVL